MPSIRRSLVAYFLLLTATAATAVGLLVDRYTAEAIHARETAETERARQKFETRRAETQEKFDEELLRQAQTLARDVRHLTSLESFGSELFRLRVQLGSLMIARPLDARGTYLTIAAVNSRPVRDLAFWTTFSLPQLDERVRRALVDEGHVKNFAIRLPWSHEMIRSRTGKLPEIQVEAFEEDFVGDHKLDEVKGEGEVLRRVTLRSSLLPPRGLMRPPPGKGRDFPPVPPQGGRLDPHQFVYVATAAPRSELELRILEHEHSLEEEIAVLQEDARRGIAWLRVRLLIIVGATIATLGWGGWSLVGRGLAPVAHLSEAVSQISERDFRLPIERSEMSVELTPIHDRLTSTLAALRAAFEREKQSIADISHELRTPIASLLATLDVSLRKPRSAEQYRETLVECRDLGKQLGSLVERILTLARMDAGSDPVRIEITDVAFTAEECEAVIRPLAQAREMKFQVSAMPGAIVRADPNHVREVFTNLLHNAIEYGKPGGTIDFRISIKGNQVIGTVADDGIGMSPEVMKHIFERFYRADPARHDVGIHAGLGLSIVKGYIERMKGTVSVESSPGKGSTFRVELPRCEE